MGSFRDREVAFLAPDRQGSNFEFCVWRTLSSDSSHNPQDVLLAQFSLHVHTGGLNPFILFVSKDNSEIPFFELINLTVDFNAYMHFPLMISQSATHVYLTCQRS